MKGAAVEMATENDMTEVLALLNQSFSSVQRSAGLERGSRFWEWKYRESPFGPAAVQIVRIDGRIAAAGCLWPMSLIVGDKKLRALQPCDTAVHPDFRRRGLFGYLNRARKEFAVERGVDVVFNFPNENSLPGYLKAGWTYVGRVPWLVRLMNPLAVLRDRRNPGQSVALDVPVEYRFERDLVYDVSSPELKWSDFISIARPPGFFKWRFIERPNRQYGIVRSKSDMDGLAVFTLSRKESGLIEMVIVDFLCGPDSLPSLLDEVLKCAKRIDAGFIAFMKPQSFALWPFYRRAFFPMREKNLAVLSIASNLPAQITDMSSWDLRAAMHDSI